MFKQMLDEGDMAFGSWHDMEYRANHPDATDRMVAETLGGTFEGDVDRLNRPWKMRVWDSRITSFILVVLPTIITGGGALTLFPQNSSTWLQLAGALVGCTGVVASVFVAEWRGSVTPWRRETQLSGAGAVLYRQILRYAALFEERSSDKVVFAEVKNLVAAFQDLATQEDEIALKMDRMVGNAYQWGHFTVVDRRKRGLDLTGEKRERFDLLEERRGLVFDEMLRLVEVVKALAKAARQPVVVAPLEEEAWVAPRVDTSFAEAHLRVRELAEPGTSQACRLSE